MAYTEIKTRNRKKYYYRVVSIREGDKVSKKRVYLGKDLSKEELILKENEADNKLNKRKKEEKSKATQKIIEKIRKILKKNKIKKAGIFGSYATGEQTKNSDIDILIEPKRGMGLKFVGLALELEDELGKKIDLVTYKGLSPYLKKYILEEEIKII